MLQHGSAGLTPSTGASLSTGAIPSTGASPWVARPPSTGAILSTGASPSTGASEQHTVRPSSDACPLVKFAYTLWPSVSVDSVARFGLNWNSLPFALILAVTMPVLASMETISQHGSPATCWLAVGAFDFGSVPRLP